LMMERVRSIAMVKFPKVIKKWGAGPKNQILALRGLGLDRATAVFWSRR